MFSSTSVFTSLNDFYQSIFRILQDQDLFHFSQLVSQGSPLYGVGFQSQDLVKLAI